MASRILVVDDLLPNIRLLEAKLTSQYYEVETAQNGMEALKKAQENPPDIILLDVMMPEMDGFETCKRLKENPKTTHVPVVMVTALTEVSDRVQGLNAGADDFITKPINDHALFARIRSLVRLKSMTDELRLRNQTIAEFDTAADQQQIDDMTKNAQILLIDDDAAQAQQISTTLSKFNMQVKVHQNPRDAISSTEANNYDLIIVSNQLTEGSALDLCSHLHSLEKTRSTPLLIILEDLSGDVLVKAFDMGVNDYIVSPIDSNEVSARAKTQIRRKRFQDALKKNQEKSLSMAITDALTGLYNRRYFDTHLAKLLQDAIDTNRELGIIIIDIDHFKKVNDTYGHLSGDEILKQLPKRILSNIRSTDLAVRYGGEEFVVICPKTDVKGTALVAERIRRSVEAKKFKVLTQEGEIKCTISCGVTASVSTDDVKSIVERADKALYHVKETSRNKVAALSGKNKK